MKYLLDVDADRARATYEEGTITEVDNGNGVTWVTYVNQDGDVLTFGRDVWAVEPEEGQTVRVYGGKGHPIRGVEIEGEVAWWRDEVTQDAEQRAMTLRTELERIEKFLANREQWDAEIEALPEPFRSRIEKFWNTNEAEWRWMHEPYEMACIRDAVKIAGACQEVVGRNPSRARAENWFERFRQMEYAEQVERYGLDRGHSGNTFGMAVHLAWCAVVEPIAVVMEHAAISSLLGCDEAGCPHPPPRELVERVASVEQLAQYDEAVAAL